MHGRFDLFLGTCKSALALSLVIGRGIQYTVTRHQKMASGVIVRGEEG
jgi:hypothetical protein